MSLGPYVARPLLTLALLASPAVVAAQAQTGEKSIVVNLQRQRLFAWEGTTRAFALDCLASKPGRAMTPGTFRVLSKATEYQAARSQSPMPSALVLTEDGRAIHGSPLATPTTYTKYFTAHEAGAQGSVGLSERDAARLFDWAETGTRVEILPFGRKFTYRYDDGTGVWDYAGNGEWLDTHPSGHKYSFRVAAQTEQFVELLDRPRNIRVRLHGDGRNQFASGTGPFGDSPRGIWTDD